MHRFLVAGGGTGGHLFPGVAVAEEFLRRDPGTEILFVGTGRPVEKEILGARGLKNRSITAAGLKGKSMIGRLKSLFSLPLGLFQSLSVIFKFKPDLVFGVGGYVSGPVSVAARLMGVPTAIHEQNSVPGMTNRLLGKLVNLVFISFRSSENHFPTGKVHLTGNPIRKEIIEAAESERSKDSKGFVVMTAGGSQGAHAVNEAMVEAIRIAAGKINNLSVIHQTGTADCDQVTEEYKKIGVRAEVQAFITDMERAYSEADLIICRAGALTVAEVAAMGRPAVFIPLPTAADNHQEINARSLVDEGAAEIILQADLTPELLAERLTTLAGDRERLRDMGKRALEAAFPNATEKICDICDAYVRKRAGQDNG